MGSIRSFARISSVLVLAAVSGCAATADREGSHDELAASNDALQIPALDDVKYAELLGELLTRIPVHTPDWTNFDNGPDGIPVADFPAEIVAARASRWFELVPDQPVRIRLCVDPNKPLAVQVYDQVEGHVHLIRRGLATKPGCVTIPVVANHTAVFEVVAADEPVVTDLQFAATP